VAPNTAFVLGARADDPLAMYLTDIFTVTTNLAGLCGISVPCGMDREGLPIGLQLLGPSLGEEQLLRTAHAYEAATDWHTLRPPEPIGPAA
jgi:aspartyl-tRNA(Asn)/glutamyl-tRNA(Gln) amidotransferase subunit A